jgi:hypothetical protein
MFQPPEYENSFLEYNLHICILCTHALVCMYVDVCVYIVTCINVTIHGVWIGNRIY